MQEHRQKYVWDFWIIFFIIISIFYICLLYTSYDIKKDPFEMNNLADVKKYSKKKAELTMELQKWMKQQNDTGADKDRPRAPKNKQKKAANV